MVSVSGVRGRVGDGLTPEIITRFAAGFGAWTRKHGASRTVVVGRDSRVSGPMFHRATIAALQSVGCDVLDVGLAPTPTIQLAVEYAHAAGGLAITASHNPIEWNALKFIGPSGLFLDAAEGAAMRAMVEGDFPFATWDQLGTVTQDTGAIARHLDAVLALPFVQVDRIRKRAFRIALDCANGAGGAIMPALLERLGCTVTGIHLETDGKFPRSPEPVAANLGELERLVLHTGADVGLATDPDVDRLALVSDEGRAIGEDWTLALAARLALRYRPGPVVANLSTSRIVDDVAAEAGTKVIRAPVGEVNVALRMKTEGAAIGGEGNGGVILSELHLGRDAPVGVALLLQMLVEDGEPLSRVLGRYPAYRIVKDKLDR
ncbi:MAG: phosphoglucosamine mutase, partial [Gemmatimonadaceae bacterium]